MPVKIRLSRKGRRGRPYYHIVVADSRAPRDGRFIEKLGVYNPLVNPALIQLDFDKALSWLQKGAQPTDTCRSLLSSEGVLLKKHLLEGVKKGAFNAEEAERRFTAWKEERLRKLEEKKSQAQKSKEEEARKRFEAEAKVRELRAQEIAKKNAEKAKAEAAAAESTPVSEDAPSSGSEASAEESGAESPAE
jgi:small subunit ribosomal protein S16